MPASHLNHNVKLALWWSLLENMSASVRSGDVLSALLYLLTKSNTAVGLIQGANGVMQMLTALPTGYLADRHRRDTMLRAGAAVGAVAGGVLAAALLLRPTVWVLGLAMALLGCYRGVYSAALEAIFADSIQQGRSGPFTRKYTITVLASSFGPWLSLALFHHLGNRWDPLDCRLVLLSGVALMVPPLALMCLFDDDKALAHQQGCQGAGRGPGRQHVVRQQDPGAQDAQSGRAPLLDGASDGLQPGLAGCHGHAEAGCATDSAEQEPQQSSCALEAGSASNLVSLAQHQGSGQPRRWIRLHAGLMVALLITVSDFIGAFASGMTIKFFAMYFMQAVKCKPITVSLIGALSPLGVSVASVACQPLSKRVGRVQISLVTRSLDICLLVLMAYLPYGTPLNRRVLVAVHLARAAVANATRPLMRSVLMDFVPRRHRGKVNGLDSIRTFSWSGSAAVGGFLIERIGFRHTFLVTACIKAAAFLPLFPLLAYVPDGICLPPGSRAARLERMQRTHEEAASAAVLPPCEPMQRGEAADDDSGLRQPLLQNGKGPDSPA